MSINEMDPTLMAAGAGWRGRRVNRMWQEALEWLPFNCDMKLKVV